MSASRCQEAVFIIVIVSLVISGPLSGTVLGEQTVEQQTSSPISRNGTQENASTLQNGSSQPGTGSSGLTWLKPATWLQHALQWIVGSVIYGISQVVGFFNDFLFGLPAPGQVTNPATWTAPDDPWWSGVWETYWLFAFLGIVALVPAWMLVQGQSAKQRRAGYRRLIKSLVMILGGFPIATFGLHVGRAVSLGLAPGGMEFMQTPGNVAKLGIGVVLGSSLVLIKAGIIVIGMFVLFLQYFLTYVVVGFWPLFWTLIALPLWSARTAGKLGLALYMTLILVKIFQTALLRFLFELPLAGFETVMTTVATTVGLFVAIIGLPYLFAQKVLPGAVMAMSGKAQQAVDRTSPLRKQYERTRKQISERVDNTLPESLSTPDSGNNGQGYGPLPSRSQYGPARSWTQTANVAGASRGNRTSPEQIDRSTDRLPGIE